MRIQTIRLVLVCAAMSTAAACASNDPAPAAPKTSLSTGLLGYYNFEGDATDSGSGGRDGTLLGGASVDQGDLALGSKDQDALSLPAGMIDGLVDFSFAAWIRFSTFHVWSSQWISGATAALPRRRLLDPGDVDHLRIYNRALSASEANELAGMMD